MTRELDWSEPRNGSGALRNYTVRTCEPRRGTGTMQTSPGSSETRELHHRNGGGIDVTLLWDPRTDGVYVAVFDERTSDWFWIQVDGSDALDAFYHPYAYEHPRVETDELLDLTRSEQEA
jgi:hypothetical protein